MKRIRLPLRLLPALLILQPLHGGDTVMDFNAIVTAGSETSVPNPWTEDGLVLTCTNPNVNLPSNMVIRTTTGSNTGQKSVSAEFAVARMSLTRSGGGVFTMKSIRLFPLVGTGVGSVTFTGVKAGGGGTVSASFLNNTGNHLGGVVHTFPATFDNLEELRWDTNNNISGAAYHQFDDITVELPPLVIVPPDITLSEGNTGVNLILRREGDSTGTLEVGCTWAPVTATTTDILLGIGSPHTFSFGSGEESKSFFAVASGDTQDEPAETAVITWTPDPSYVLSAPTTTITIGDTNASNYYNYVNGHGLFGGDAEPDADPNGDGVSNIVAYACQLNPAGPVPATWRERLPRFTTDGPYPALTWMLLPTPNDVEFIVRESTDLDEWTEIARRKGYGIGSLWTGPVASRVDENTGIATIVTVPGTERMNSLPRSFLQVEMKYSPPGGAE